MIADGAADPSLVGDVCHIVARAGGGARADPNFPEEFVNSYDNVVLMCKIHHKFIDDNPSVYTSEKLRNIKRSHETWVDSTLSTAEKEAQNTKEEYAQIVTEWEERADIKNWSAWSSHIVNVYPHILKDRAENFHDLEDWTNSRWWPNKLTVLEAAFVNYAKWIRMLLFVLNRHTKVQGEFYITPKFYQIDEWNEEKYKRIFKVWENHLLLLEDIMIETCKAANLIATLTRQDILPVYRREEGKFMLHETNKRASGHFAGVFEYDAPEVGDGLPYLRNELYEKLSKQEI